MNEEADTTEVVEAIERLRRNYRKPFPPTTKVPDRRAQPMKPGKTNEPRSLDSA